MEQNQNATAALLAVDLAYYEKKADEALDLLQQLSDGADKQQISISMNSIDPAPGAALHVSFSVTARDEIGALILTELFLHFRRKVQYARSLLNSYNTIQETPN